VRLQIVNNLHTDKIQTASAVNKIPDQIIMNRMQKKTGIYFLILIISTLLLYNCSDGKKSSVPSNEKGRISEELKTKENLYLRLLHGNFDSSQIVLQDLLSDLDALSTSKKYLAAPIYSELAAGEADKKYSSLSDSLMNLSLQLSRTYLDSSSLGVVYLNYASILNRKSMIDSAEHMYQKAISLSVQFKDTSSLIRSMTYLGTLILNQHNSDEGIRYMKHAMEMCTTDELQKNKSDLCNNIGTVLERRGNYAQALNYYQQSIDILERIHSPRNFLNPLNNMTNIYLELGEDSLALNNYMKVLKIAKEIKNVSLETTTLINLGNYYYTQSDLNKSYEYSKKALQQLEGRIEGSHHAIIYLNIGSIKKDRKKYEEAIAYLKKSLAISERIKAIELVNESKMELATVYFMQQQYSKSEVLAKDVFESAIKNHNINLKYKSARILSKIHKANHNNKLAFKYFKLHEKFHSQFQDTLNAKQVRIFAFQNKIQKKDAKTKQLLLQHKINQQKISRQKILIILAFFIVLSLASVVMLYVIRFREKQKKNKLLRFNNAQIQEKNSILEQENQFKNKLFSIVSHDIKSPLISLHNFLNLLEMEELDEDEKEEILQETIKKNETTLNMIEDLLLWTKQQMNAQDENVRFNFYPTVLEVFDLFKTSAKEHKIELIVDCPDLVWVYSNPNLIKMVIRNLISNALKFTPEHGKIIVGIHKTDHKFTISIQDTGNGIPKEDQSKIFDDQAFFTTDGEQKEKGHGLGLKLCKYFIEKNKGNIWFESEEKKGTQFFIQFPNNSQ